jgi:acyl-coenzyme A thioesterase PaaI-like protein
MAASPYIQDYYPDDLAWCYGCGRYNAHGHHFQTAWEGDETVTRFTPEPYHIAIPGFVYGGLLASLIDCHSTGSAALAAYRAEGHEPGDDAPVPRFVTAALHVNYLKPTPLGVTLEARGRIKEVKARKVVVETTVYANGEACVTGEAVLVKMPEHMVPTDLPTPPQT